jgi:hypothetical protein
MPTNRPVASLASCFNQFAAAIKASPPRNQLIVLKCNSNGTGLLTEAAVRLSVRKPLSIY